MYMYKYIGHQESLLVASREKPKASDYEEWTQRDCTHVTSIATINIMSANLTVRKWSKELLCIVSFWLQWDKFGEIFRALYQKHADRLKASRSHGRVRGIAVLQCVQIILYNHTSRTEQSC